MDLQAPTSPILPPEIVSLILKVLEHDKDALKNCSLTCNAWHDLCLPSIFHTLTISDDKDYIRAFRRFMIISPHLRAHIRRTTLHISDRKSWKDAHLLLSSGWLDDEHTESLISSLPNLIDADCCYYPLTALSSALPQLPITTLRLERYFTSAAEFLGVLAAGGKTLRSLTLDYIECHTPLSTLPTTESLPTTTMVALEELNVNFCTNLPFEPEAIQMPRLQDLFVADDSVMTFAGCLPDSLKTLAVDAYEDELPPSSKILLVENLCLLSPGYWDSLSAVLDTINRYTIPSSIKHLEVVLFQDPPHGEQDMVLLDNFEEFLLDLHEIGLFKKFTISMHGDMNPRAYDGKFPTLRLLGLFETRIGLPSIMYPQSAEIYGH